MAPGAPSIRLAAGLQAAPDALGRIVVRRPGGGLVRLTSAQWATLRAVAEGRDVGHPNVLEGLLTSARAHGLLLDAAPAEPRRTVEFSMAAPLRTLGRAGPLTRVALGSTGLVGGAALAVIGLLAALASGRLLSALSGPVSPLSLGGLALALTGLTLLHELAHAAALTCHGGRPGRLGLRLRPGLPTGFCEIGDVWLLPPDLRRISVALAGIWTHAVVGGTTLTVVAAAPGLPGTTTGTVTALFGLTALVAALGNSVPVGHTDGSLARALARDVP